MISNMKINFFKDFFIIKSVNVCIVVIPTAICFLLNLFFLIRTDGKPHWIFHFVDKFIYNSNTCINYNEYYEGKFYGATPEDYHKAKAYFLVAKKFDKDFGRPRSDYERPIERMREYLEYLKDSRH